MLSLFISLTKTKRLHLGVAKISFLSHLLHWVFCSGEFSQESTGVLYKGKFGKGLFHGGGEMLWFSERDRRKKYIGDFRNGHMHGHGEMK